MELTKFEKEIFLCLAKHEDINQEKIKEMYLNYLKGDRKNIGYTSKFPNGDSIAETFLNSKKLKERVKSIEKTQKVLRFLLKKRKIII